MTFKPVLVALATLSVTTQAQHAHLNAGAAGKNQADPLIWVNGDEFDAANGYVKTLDFATAGTYAGYYVGNLTPTALPTTPDHGGPDPAAAAPGAFLQFRIACLEAPPGGAFGFWESGAASPSVSVMARQNSTNLWPLSEGDGSPDSDPYGHVHGRRYTATKPGLYKIGFTAVDTSTNGLAGGPIHTPSDELPVWFQAGVNIQSLVAEPLHGQLRVRFGAPIGFSWQVESSTTADVNGVWQPWGAPEPGADHFADVTSSITGERQFFRVRGTQVAP